MWGAVRCVMGWWTPHTPTESHCKTRSKASKIHGQRRRMLDMKSATKGGHDKRCAIMEAGEHVELISATIVVWCAPGQFCSLHGCRNERSSRKHQDACQDVRACPVPVAAFLRLTCESYSFTPPNPIRNPWLRVHSKPQAARLNPPIAVLTHYALQ